MRHGCFGAGFHEMMWFALFRCLEGWFMWERAVGIILGMGYAKRGCWRCLVTQLCKMRWFAFFGGSVMQNRAVCIVLGLGYGKVETGLLASFGCMTTQNGEFT